MKKKYLKVIYKEKININLDKRIQGFFEKLGFEWVGQGFNLETKERDISFIMPEKILKECFKCGETKGCNCGYGDEEH